MGLVVIWTADYRLGEVVVKAVRAEENVSVSVEVVHLTLREGGVNIYIVRVHGGSRVFGL